NTGTTIKRPHRAKFRFHRLPWRRRPTQPQRVPVAGIHAAYNKRGYSMNKTLALLAATGAALSLNAQAATKWDLPSAYPASNLHTQNLEQFVSDVDKLSEGDFKITLHSNASLYKAPEIK